MESDSPEIDFLSLEDELYDNEITQILSQPSAAESTYTDLLEQLIEFVIFLSNKLGVSRVSEYLEYAHYVKYSSFDAAVLMSVFFCLL